MFVCKLFSSKISQELLNLGFLNLVQMLGITSCIVQERISLLLLIIPFVCQFFFLSNKNFCHRFLGFYESQSSDFVYTLRVAKYIVGKKIKMLRLIVALFFHLSLQCNTKGNLCQRFLKNNCI